MIIRKAKKSDIEQIIQLINIEAQKGLMLSRNPWELTRFLRDFCVADDGRGEILGCSALSIYLDDLAEVRSLVVASGARKKGIGKKLAEFCLAEAKDLEIGRVFTLTYVPGFFEKIGFVLGDRATVQQKIYEDCIRCRKFYSCDEIFLVKKII
jgi:amino-acid N-acetyltransferase